MSPDDHTRCWWCGDDSLYQSYHDEEWGVPVHDDREVEHARLGQQIGIVLLLLLMLLLTLLW